MSQGKFSRNSSSIIVSATADSIRHARDLILRGELVAFPTETVYGLGADAWNEVAVAKIFKVKGRPSTNPLILHVPKFETIHSVAGSRITQSQIRYLDLLAHFFPGPLTVVLPRGGKIASGVSGGGDSVAVRVPQHKVALELLRLVGRPIAAPSANPSGYVSPTTAQHVADSLISGVSLILDGGPCEVGIESTVLSLTGARPRLLRPGAVSIDAIEAAIKERIDVGAPKTTSANSESPGLLTQHYSPTTRVVLRGEIHSKDYPRRVGLLHIAKTNDSNDEFPYTRTAVASRDGSLEDGARNLFSTLRSFDDGSLELIVIVPCEEEGIGLAIMDRVRRAAAGIKL